MHKLQITSYGVQATLFSDSQDLIDQLKMDFCTLNDDSNAESCFTINIVKSMALNHSYFFIKGKVLGLGFTSNGSIITGNKSVTISRKRDHFSVVIHRSEHLMESLRLLLFSEWIWRIGKRTGWLPLHAMAYDKDGKGQLVIGPMYAGKSTFAKNILESTTHNLLGDELIWYDGHCLHPFCTNIRYREKQSREKRNLLPPKDRIAEAVPLTNIQDLANHSFYNKNYARLLYFTSFVLGLGLPQMLVLNLSPSRLITAITTLVSRTSLAIKLSAIMHSQA